MNKSFLITLLCSLIMCVSCSKSDVILESVDGSEEGLSYKDYVIKVGAKSEGNLGSRGTTMGVGFDEAYEPDKIYIHSVTGEDEDNVVTVDISNGQVAFILREYSDESFAICGDPSGSVDDSENVARYSPGEQIYFSSWPSNLWSYREPDAGKESEIAFNGINVPVMWLQNRSNMNNWREMYRSHINFGLNRLSPGSPSGSDLEAYGLVMDRIVGAYRVTVVFTDFNQGANTVSKDKWSEIIPETSPDDWKIKVYLGKFPTKYDLRKNTIAENAPYGYYVSNEGRFTDLAYTFYAEGGAGGEGEAGGNQQQYEGFGLTTAQEYLMTPVEYTGNDKKALLDLYAFITYGGKTMVYHEDNSNAYAKQNYINHFVPVFDVRQLAVLFGLSYRDYDGVLQKPSVANTSAGSRTTFMGYEIADIKPIKTYCISE